MLKVLVTGVNGFVGKHIVPELKSRGHEVIGLAHSGPADERISGLLSEYYECDLTKPDEVAKLPLDTINAVINLAGLANVGESFADPEKYKDVNVGILKVLGEALVAMKSGARVIAVSTGAVYDSNQPLPLRETSKTILDGSPYAISKLLMEETAEELRNDGLDCVVVRPFNHFGPGQLPGFLIPDLYQKIMHAKENREPVKVGNLATRRDYTDVRDIVKAYTDLALAETLGFDTYNVCSGKSRSGQEILDYMLEGLGASELEIEIDQSFIRPSDPPDLRGSYARLKEETGWEPVIPFGQTIKDLIKYNSV